MKTMTCRQMGGPCDEQISGNTPEEMMNNGKDHVHSMDDEDHKNVVVMMEEMQKDPAAAKEWNVKFTSDFEALADN